jgi:hypothetical protein
MKRIIFLTMAFLTSLWNLDAQTTVCTDLNGYVDAKNVGATGYYTLRKGYEEHAAQTYHFSGGSKISQVVVYGKNVQSGGVPLRVSVYNVDVNGRPTTLKASADGIFWASDSLVGYITISLPEGGTYVDGNFAIGVSILNAWPWGNTFQLKYNGNGEGLGEDLASLSGTSTGNNWSSALVSFDKDGDFYLVPRMKHFITSTFTTNSLCVGVGTPIAFTNSSSITKDSMFNKLFLSDYSGSYSLYSWDFGDGSTVSHVMNPTHSYADPGTYEVSLTTVLVGWEGSSQNVKTMTISVGLGINTPQITDVSCHGGNDGTIQLSGSGGVPPLLYSLDGTNFQSGEIFENLTAGMYTTYVKDANECINSSSIQINEPEPITFTAATTSAGCGNSNGAILVEGIGGTEPFLFALNSGSFQSSGSFTNLTAGAYQVSVKDGNGCIVHKNVPVNNVGAPVLSVLSLTNVSCHGGSDASIVLSGTGGVGTLNYSINGGFSYQTDGSFVGLPVGSYVAMVKDAAGCSRGISLYIYEPNEIKFSANAQATLCNGSNDGQITFVNAIGGIGTLTYSVNGLNYQSNPHFIGLGAGSYSIYVRDAAACTVEKTIIVNEAPELSANFNLNAATCFGQDNGVIEVVAVGGSQPYSFAIEDGVGQPSNLFDNLDAGVYHVTVSDFAGCTYSEDVTVSEPTDISTTITATNATCGNNNGGLLVEAFGGSGSGYLFSIDGMNYNTNGSFDNLGAGNYFIIVKDGNECHRVASKTILDANGPVITSYNTTDIGCHGGSDGSITINQIAGGTGSIAYSIDGLNWTSSSSFSGLTAGTYTMYVKDVNGCFGSESVTLMQPSAFQITNNIQHVSCHGGNDAAVTIYAAGGAGTLAYSLDEGLNFQSSNIFTSLDAGNYSVTVRDVAGCEGVIYFHINEPFSVGFIHGTLDVTCHGDSNGSISVYAFGGTGTLNYSMDEVTFQNSNVFSNLNGGVYTIYVKDENNCVIHHNITIQEPDELVINALVSDVVCFGGNNGAIDVTVDGGNGNNHFLWSNDETSEDLSNLANGSYSVLVVDGEGCQSLESFDVYEPTSPIIINAAVYGTVDSLGAIDISVTGGTDGYTFSWSNGAESEDLSHLVPGTYAVTVTDDNGCVASDEFTVENSVGLKTIETSGKVLTVYPNPTYDLVTINHHGSVMDDFSILNMLGETVYHESCKQAVYQFNTINLEGGIYMVQVRVNGIVSTSKLQVIK